MGGHLPASAWIQENEKPERGHRSMGSGNRPIDATMLNPIRRRLTQDTTLLANYAQLKEVPKSISSARRHMRPLFMKSGNDRGLHLARVGLQIQLPALRDLDDAIHGAANRAQSGVQELLACSANSDLL